MCNVPKYRSAKVTSNQYSLLKIREQELYFNFCSITETQNKINVQTFLFK